MWNYLPAGDDGGGAKRMGRADRSGSDLFMSPLISLWVRDEMGLLARSPNATIVPAIEEATMLKTGIVAGLIGILSVGIASAQMTPEEAMQKLRERQAADTQPEDLQSEIHTLKLALADQAKQIDALKLQIAQLRTENSTLKKQVAANPPDTTGPAGAKIWKGMTKAQLLDVLGTPTADESSADGSEHMQWNHLVAKPAQGFVDPSDLNDAINSQAASMSWVTDKTRWSINHYIDAYLRADKVTDLTDRHQN
jgi:hypothetical protein